MPDFILLLRGGEESLQDFSPQELQLHLNKYFAWIEALATAGHYKGSQPLAPEGKVISGKGGAVVKDGPFAESKEAIGGYFLIQAKDLDQAVAIAKGCPCLEVGGMVEIRPISVEIAEGLEDRKAGSDYF